MKKILTKASVPVLLGVAVFTLTLLYQRYTLLMQEQCGFFAAIPDYFRQVFSDKLPVSTLCSDFLVQFYREAWLGALITALIVLAIYGLTCVVFRFTRFRQPIATLVSCAAWVLIAHSKTPRAGVIFLLAAALVALVSVCIPYKWNASSKHPLPALLVSLLIIIAAGVGNLADKKLRDNERWFAMEYATRSHDWNLVLQIATPQRISQNMALAPYAILALNAQGRLGEQFLNYPIQGPQSFDRDTEVSWSAYSLSSLIYECMSLPNEAIHLAFQAACSVPYGMSFGSLRQLMRLNMEAGNYTMVRKYAAVLARSPFNVGVAKNAMKMVEGKADVEPVRDALHDGMISNNPMYNLGEIMDMGIVTQPVVDRSLCYLLSKGEIQSFETLAIQIFGSYDKVPAYYQRFFGSAK